MARYGHKKKKPTTYAALLGRKLKAIGLAGRSMEERNALFTQAAHEASQEWRALHPGHNPFLETAVGGFATGMGFGGGFKAVNVLLGGGTHRNPSFHSGELVTLAGAGTYGGRDAEVIEKVKRGMFGRTLYRVKPVGQEQTYLVRASSMLPFGTLKNPMPGELVRIKSRGAYGGQEGKFTGYEGGGFLGLGKKKARLVLPSGEQVIVPASVLAALNPRRVGWNGGKAADAKKKMNDRTLYRILTGRSVGYKTPGRKQRNPGHHNIKLEGGQFGWDYIVKHDDGRDLLVQSDWEYPDVARTFGWAPRKTFRSQSAEIQAAAKWLDAHIGKKAEDPGYFSNPEIPFDQQHIRASINPGQAPNEIEIPFDAQHIRASINPGEARCPIHGTPMMLRRGAKSVTCPKGGERWGIKP